MSKPLLHFLLPLMVTSLAPSAMAEETLNRMLGRQAHNSGIPVVPAPGAVKIDGDLSEWDLSGKIWSFADVEVRDEFSVETAAMWDKEALYVTTIWRDPTPMINRVDPDVNPDKGWVSDALQLRISSDKTQWLTFWHYTPKDENILHIEEWESKEKSGGERPVRLLRGENGKELGEGVQIAYRKSDDGLGFVQEIRLPWTLIFNEVPKLEPGLSVNMGLEFIWGEPSGTRPFHRYADNLQPGVTSREFFWTAYKAWGPAELQANGSVKPRTYIPEDWKIQGVANFELELPAEARRFTVVVEDEKGKRVRSLGADLSPQDYKIGEKEGKIVVSVPWDLRDNLNQVVPAGHYKARGLYHQGLQADFDTYYYMPGVPPWQDANPASAWLSDHNNPSLTTRAGDMTLVAAVGAEGGSGLMALDANGKKIWGEHRGARALAADDRYIYAVGLTTNATGTLWRYDHQGGYQGYTLKGETMPFDLLLSNVLDPALAVSAIAVQGPSLLVALRPLPAKEGEEAKGAPQLVALDKETLAAGKGVPLPGVVTHLATGPKDTLYGLIDGRLYRLDFKGGKHQEIALPGVAAGAALVVDSQGRLLVFDKGPDQQIKRFTAEGKPAGTIGKKGGHLRHGAFDEHGVREVNSISIDQNGLIWAVSDSVNPRRVTAWNEEGKLVHSFVGNSQYAGTGSYLNPDHPDLAYIGALEFKLDRENNHYTLQRILWNPDQEKNEAFELWSYPHWFANPAFLKRTVNGKPVEFLYHRGAKERGYFSAVYLPKGEFYQPVAAVFNGGYATQQLPNLPWPEEKQMTIFWNDTNRDGAVSMEECEIVPETIAISGYWGSLPNDKMEVYAADRKGTLIHRPVGFDADGAPRYAKSGIETVGLRAAGDYFPLPEENQVLVLGSVADHGSGIYGMKPDMSEVLWHWPSPYIGVHGSHHAPMSRPGLVIGPLKFMGIAEVNDHVGQVTAMRGNLGQDFYFTSDGLMIGAIFRDGRLPRASFPETYEEFKKTPLQAFSMGGEPFSGWLGRMKDGRILNTSSLLRQGASIIEMKGLDKIRRFNAPKPLQVTDALRVAAEAVPPVLDPSQKKKETYGIARVEKPFTLDPKEAKQTWNTLRRGHIKSPTSAFTGMFAIGYDDDNLYVELQATDPSPWRNTGRNFATLFKTGDAFDLQIGPAGAEKRRQPGAGDQRIVIANFDGKPTAVVMRPVDKEASDRAKHTYRSPVMEKAFDRVEQEDRIQTSVVQAEGRWTVRAIIPFEVLGLKPKAGDQLGADIGFISSDEAGSINTARTYWSNHSTALVNDEPSEAWIQPDRWGILNFLPAKGGE